MKIKKNKICVIGQGFVGLPMSIAIANSKDNNGSYFNVIGIEKNNSKGNFLKKKINNGKLPFVSEDKKLKKIFQIVSKNKNFYISTNINDMVNCKVVIISINFEINYKQKDPFYFLKIFFRKIAEIISKNTLIILETTFPPGTCDKIIYPELIKNLYKRGFSQSEIMLSYSYERIMPGKDYYNSIVNNYRVYSGINTKSKIACKNFLSKIINIKRFPLTLLNTNTECEFSKILENTYRASNIALIDEWTKYSRIAKIDIYNVLDAIRKRETHKNIMRPGLGVGGYCLTKDPLFAIVSAKKIFRKKNNFPFIELMMKTNANMPLTSLRYIKDKINPLKKKKILLLGLSYREGVGDYRSSPSIILYEKLKQNGAIVHANDPLINIELEIDLKKKIVPQKYKYSYYDSLIFCVNHKEYKNIDIKKISKKTTLLDLNNIIKPKIRKMLKKNHFKIFTLGKD